MSWRTKWKIRESWQNSLWIVPLIFAAIAVALGTVLPALDEDAKRTIGIEFGSDAARAVLAAIAGGMITFTGFVFSILLLAVQFGSSQFSPRLLRRFLRDPTTRIAFGIFVATFIYSLLVLRTVGLASNEEFVPSNSVTIALIMLLLSMLMFLRLIDRTTQSLRVASVLRQLGKDARRVIAQVYPEPAVDPASEAEIDAEPSAAEPSAVVKFDDEPGILQSVDPGLVAIARDADVTIELVPPIGDFVIPGSSLFRVYGASEIDAELLRASVAVGDERTMRQDPAFAFRLLADISSKALSPGINDPTTSTQALDQIEMLLLTIATRRLTPGVARDEEGRVRFRRPAPSWDDYLSLALDETRQFGEGSVQVMRRLEALLEDLRDAVPSYRRPAVEAKLALLSSGVSRAFSDEGDRESAATGDRQGIGSSRTEPDNEG